MRPLPDLSPLPPLGDVYNPTTDDFTQLLSDQTDTLDNLQSQLDPGVDQTLADAQAVSDALDAALGVYDGIDQTFGQLDQTTNDLEVAQAEANAIGIERSFADALDAFNPDLGLVADAIGSLFQVAFAFTAWLGLFYHFAGGVIESLSVLGVNAGGFQFPTIFPVPTGGGTPG
jgi:hypothetical protein